MTSTLSDAVDRPRGLGTLLNGVGAVIVGFWLFVGNPAGDRFTGWVVVVAVVALVAWIARVIVRSSPLGDVAVAVMVVGGAVATVPTNGLLITPALVGIIAVTIDRRRPVAIGAGGVVVASVIVIGEGIAAGWTPTYHLSVIGGLVICFIIGFNRRQTAMATERERELLARNLEIEREQQRSALLADRARVARDIHDVLAHSLGGLVIQLDAVEALLEKGRVEDAAARVSAARTLAAEGLGEARRAVATLRDPGSEAGAGSPGERLAAADAFDRLLTAHESLGGRAVASGRDALGALDPDHARALAGVLREALSNARRHAPGEVVTVAASLERVRGILRLTISNPAPTELDVEAAPDAPPAGGGHGLPGMRERIAELGDASRIDITRPDGAFEIEVEVALP